MASFEVVKSDDGFEVEDNFTSATKIMVFGVGGGGGNAVANMVDSGVCDVDYVIANTDVGALRTKDGSKMKRVQIGRKTTRGQGAGNNPAVGQQSAEESRDEIAGMLEDTSMIFIAAGMGGGTGTGAAPVVASIAKEKKILTVGVVTKPFRFEGAKKMEQAVKGISEMRKYVDALIVIPNERVNQLSNSRLTVKDGFKAVDDVLCKAVIGIITLLKGDGYINLDFADVCMALSESGIAHMAIGKGKGDTKIEDALEEVLHSPLLETSITGARRGLLNINIPYSFPLEEFDKLTTEIAEKFDSEARYKSGIVFDETLADDEISIIAVATDFEEAPENSASAAPAPSAAKPMQAVAAAPAAAKPAEGTNGFANPDDIDVLLRMFNDGRTDG